MTIPNSRRRLLISNLLHAFPDWNYSKILSVAKESAARMFEMGFFSLCYPYMSKEQHRHTVFYDEITEAKLKELRVTGRPVLFLIPHTCLFETLATSPLFRPFGDRSLGAIYRPNKNPSIDRWITQARERVGVRAFSRKEGFLKARSHLRGNNWLAVLYDQNAGVRGSGSSFLGRICSFSPLPDLLAKNKEVFCVHAVTKRLAFFRSRLELNEIPNPKKSVSESVHEILANEINSSTRGFPEWLWSHGKWKVNDMNHEIFLLQEKFKKFNFETTGKHSIQIFVRMPNWLGDAVMALPIIRAIRKGRPDASISILCKSSFVDLLNSLLVADKVHALPNSRGLKYFNDIRKLNPGVCDVTLVLTNSWRGDIESILLNSEARLGAEIKSRRTLLNFPYVVPDKIKQGHQLFIWFKMLANYSYSPPQGMRDYCKSFGKARLSSSIVLIAPGSLNSPEKRLPLKYWVKLVQVIQQTIPNLTFKIIGTRMESIICNELADNLKSAGIDSINLCGKTNLLELSETLKSSKCLLCNDSGAMHLANALGLPVFAVFGCTSPKKTGPVFDSHFKIFKAKSVNFKNFTTEDEKALQFALEGFLAIFK